MWLHLITNSTTVPTGSLRYETRNGRKYLVAPVTLIVTGVLPGSQGPGFYPYTENQKSVPLWENTPLTLRHPMTVDRKPASGRDKDVFNKVGLGTLRNVKFVASKTNSDDSKVIGEAWFDDEFTRNRAPDVHKRLTSHQPIEVSTGLGLDKIPAFKGSSFKGRSYDWVAKNYSPDHLAILPDEKGACSLKDGCGVFNSFQQSGDSMNETIWNTLFAENCKETRKPGPCAKGGPSKKGTAEGESIRARNGTKQAAAVSQSLAAQAKYNSNQPGKKDHNSTDYTKPAREAQKNAAEAGKALKAGDKQLAAEYHKDAAQSHRDAAEGHAGYSGHGGDQNTAYKLHMKAALRHNKANKMLKGLTTNSILNKLSLVLNCKETGKPGPCKGWKLKGKQQPAQPFPQKKAKGVKTPVKLSVKALTEKANEHTKNSCRSS